jgi:hypothetical protein
MQEIPESDGGAINKELRLKSEMERLLEISGQFPASRMRQVP